MDQFRKLFDVSIPMATRLDGVILIRYFNVLLKYHLNKIFYKNMFKYDLIIHLVIRYIHGLYYD